MRRASSKSALNQEAFILFYRRTELSIPHKPSPHGAPSPMTHSPATNSVDRAVPYGTTSGEGASVSSKEALKRKTPAESESGEEPGVATFADSRSVLHAPPTKKQKKGTLRDLASIFAKIRHPSQAATPPTPSPTTSASTGVAHFASSSDGDEEMVVQRPPPLQVLE